MRNQPTFAFTLTSIRRMALRLAWSVFLSISCVEASFAEEHSTEPVRGVWVANVGSTAMGSPQAVREFVELADSCRINTLYVVVWNRGMTTYPSEIMREKFGIAVDPRYAAFDVLESVVDEAHKRQIRVIAWFEFGFSCSYQKPDGGRIIRKYSHWAARDASGNLASKNGFQWMNAFHPEVQEFVLSLLQEILTNYEVDGIQGDDRLPACPSIAGYDSSTVDLYRDQHGGNSPPEDHLDPGWVNWRAGLLNTFMQRMSQRLRKSAPNKTISMAPSIYPWSKQNYLQDWPTWLKNGWVDEVCPQVYRDNLASYRTELKKITSQQVAPTNLDRVFPGILVQTASNGFNGPDNIRNMVLENRKQGFRGEVFFYDAALREYPRFFREVYP